MNSRREFIARCCQLAAVASLPLSALAALPEVAEADACSDRIPLTGVWQFRLDPDRTGETKLWHKPTSGPDWLAVEVPHTWQIQKDSDDYFGTAWYHRAFQVPREWKDRNLRVEFEAVYHSAMVWVNGQEAGQHLRKGYTTFTLDITPYVEFGASNSIVVRVDNSFDQQAMLPRGRSFDWTPDGGIYRPVSLYPTQNYGTSTIPIFTGCGRCSLSVAPSPGSWRRSKSLRPVEGKGAGVFDVQRPTGFSAFTKSWTP